MFGNKVAASPDDDEAPSGAAGGRLSRGGICWCYCSAAEPVGSTGQQASALAPPLALAPPPVLAPPLYQPRPPVRGRKIDGRSKGQEAAPPYATHLAIFVSDRGRRLTPNVEPPVPRNQLRSWFRVSSQGKNKKDPFKNSSPNSLKNIKAHMLIS